MNFTGPVEDRIAIRELCDQYCSGVMSKDAAMWSETWAEDAEWIHTGISTKGKAAIVAESSKIMDSYSAGAFFSNLGSTHITGHRATGRCHQFELFFFANGPAWFLSFYDDDYVKIDGRWYFQKRALTVAKNGTY